MLELGQKSLYEKLRGQIRKLYGDQSENIINEVEQEIEKTKKTYESKLHAPDQSTVYLICYADHIQGKDHSLKELKDFVGTYLKEAISCVHLLPFYPSSSDGGFAVKAYLEVDPDFGDWEDIRSFEEVGVSIMLDAVFNHSSSEHIWFQKYLAGDEKYRDYFYIYDEIDDSLQVELDKVTRPRAHPLMTKFETPKGDRWVWTTFSEDQVDLNISNTDVFIDLVKIYLFYLQQNTSAVRMDAVPFLWKTIGTTCSHLPETHLFLQLFKTITEIIDPSIQMIAEANVPQEENLSYLDEGGEREADLIYNFTYPPLICHAILNDTTEYMKTWLRGFSELEKKSRFFNVSSTHDGIGVRSLESIVPAHDMDILAKIAVMKGGHVSHKTMPNGLQALYELNITWASLLYQKDKDLDWNTRLLVNSHALSWTLPGVPAIYFHNLFATFNDQETFEKTKHRRDLNRKRFSRDELHRLLEEPLHHAVFDEILHILRIRRQLAAFHPEAEMTCFEMHPDVISFTRGEGVDKIHILFNNTKNGISLNLSKLGNFDHLQGQEIDAQYTLAPYEMLWLS
jgi:glycosidase